MSIKQFKKDKMLVSISRESIVLNTKQGVILGHSKDLVLLNYIYDFNLDGLMVIRRKDITSINSTKTCAFQKKHLIKEGLFKKYRF